jgi:PEP-CTERM motif
MALLLSPLASHADPVFKARISDGTSTIEIVDTDNDGFIDYSEEVFGNWKVAFAFGTSTFNPLEMHLSAGFQAVMSKFTVGESKTLTIALTQTGLSSGAGTSQVNFGAYGGGSAYPGVTGSWAAYADDSDAEFGMGTQIANVAGFTTGSGGAAPSMTGTYSATLFTTFDISGVTGKSAAGSLDLAMHVPEPGTIALAGLALLGLGAARRRKA